MRILLLGAGFTRNWGGWLAAEVFEYLLGCPQINPPLRELLLRHKRTGGFEGALAELQTNRGPAESLSRLEEAISQMFAEMDAAFGDTPFEFQNDREYLVATFLTKFDAIFTLNQDLLLERYYLNDNVGLLSDGRWDGWGIPGLVRQGAHEHPLHNPNLGLWVPTDRNGFVVHTRSQPYFKLHGSSNWYVAADRQIMVIGGNKRALIDQHPILSYNFDQFQQYLHEPDTRLMVIGYGFSDDYVNATIMFAAQATNITMFVVDPLGIDVMDANRNAQIYTPSALATAL